MIASFFALCLCVPVAAAQPAGQLPETYRFLDGALQELVDPAGPLLGANDAECELTEQHPRPVVLLHGTVGGARSNWATYGPLLANNGFCVFTTTYGGFPNWPWPGNIFGGLRPMLDDSMEEAAAFVTEVLEKTGADQVDLVGHSQGTVMAGLLAKVALPGKIHHVVSLSPLWDGTGFTSLVDSLDTASNFRASLANGSIPATADMIPGGPAMKKLWEPEAGRAATPYYSGTKYTNIATRFDWAVIPYTSGLLPGENTTNIVIQDGCGKDFSDHAAIAASPRAADFVVQALDPRLDRTIRCTPVVPLFGAASS